jgi:CheY-like chemotaxis protein
VRQRDGKLPGPPATDSEPVESRPTLQQLGENPGVLVVDGDHLVRIMVQLGLERNGFDVWLASNGRQAIQLYRKHRRRIGVVLLDVCMPGLDGPATLEALRSLNPEVLVCLMSADTGNSEPAELRRRGAVCVIAKPFLVNDLANVLRHLANGVSADALPSGGADQE